MGVFREELEDALNDSLEVHVKRSDGVVDAMLNEGVRVIVEELAYGRVRLMMLLRKKGAELIEALVDARDGKKCLHCEKVEVINVYGESLWIISIGGVGQSGDEGEDD